MTSKHLSSLQRTFLSVLLSLLLWSALSPAHFKSAQLGQMVELCTSAGISQVWVDTNASLTSTTNTASQVKSMSPAELHNEPTCTWCVLALPDVLMGAGRLFINLTLSHLIVSTGRVSYYFHSPLWRFSCPRAPPLHVVLSLAT